MVAIRVNIFRAMKKIIGEICLIVMLLCSTTRSMGQEYYYVISDSVPGINSGDLARVEQLVEKGNSVLEEAAKAEEELNEAKKSWSANPLKIKQLQERVRRLELKASTYFGDAHRMEFRLLKRSLKKQDRLAYKRIKTESGEQFRRGSILRRKAANNISGRSPLNLAVEAARYEKEAIDLVLDQMRPFAGDEEVKIASKIPDEDLTIEAEPDTSELVKMEEVKSEKDVTDESPDEEIYFSIQFLAKRDSVDEAMVKSVYNGPLQIITNKSDGWYRFSAGIFPTFTKALEVMKEEGIDGFIVAFKGETRIDTRRARVLTSDK